MPVTAPRRLWPSPSNPTPSGADADDLAGVKLLAVWGSPVGHVAALAVPDAFGDQMKVKVAVGRILRLVADAAAQVGRASPVVGVLVMSKPGAAIDVLRRWAADQDWHRGDFIVWPEAFAPEQPEIGADRKSAFRVLVEELIGSLEPIVESAPRLEGTRSATAILERAQYEAGAGGARELLARLAHALPAEWGHAVGSWATGVLEQARRAAAEELTDTDTTEAAEAAHATDTDEADA